MCADSYMVLGVGRVEVSQLVSYKNQYTLKIRAALAEARLSSVELDAVSQVARLIDAAFAQVMSAQRVDFIAVKKI